MAKDSKILVATIASGGNHGTNAGELCTLSGHDSHQEVKPPANPGARKMAAQTPQA